MILEYLFEIIWILLLASIIHELTHYFFSVLTGDYQSIDFDQGSATIHFSDNMSKKNQLWMYGLPIFSGLLFIFVILKGNINEISNIIVLMMYLLGCLFDFHKIVKILGS